MWTIKSLFGHPPAKLLFGLQGFALVASTDARLCAAQARRWWLQIPTHGSSFATALPREQLSLNATICGRAQTGLLHGAWSLLVA